MRVEPAKCSRAKHPLAALTPDRFAGNGWPVRTHHANNLKEISMALSYFAENNSGIEQLWITDGTAAGTRMVKAFAGGSIQWLTMVGAKVFFTADDGVHGSELWTSDGTAAGTVLIRDINPGGATSAGEMLTDFNGSLLFSATDGVHGFELWASDGTSAGTAMVKDILPGAGSSVLGGNLAEVNGSVFFAAQDGTDGYELWKSDGTAAGTMMVADINPGLSDSSPEFLTTVNGTLFFTADDGTHGFELWKSDGTAAGTSMVKDIDPGPNDSIGESFANVGGTLYFSASDGTNGLELWRSDGTAAGTVMVKNINPTRNSFPFEFTNVAGTAFFAADDGTHGFELWKSDGTAAGTVMVKDINSGTGNSISGVPGGSASVNGTLFFNADDGINGPQLWKSDGTAAGTVMVKLINPGGATPRQLTDIDGTLEFYAFDGTSWGLFRSDGTAAGTIELTTHVDIATPIGFASRQSAVEDLNGDHLSDVVWRSSSGTLTAWSMNGSAIASSGFTTADGVAAHPDSSWNVVGTSDFNGDGNADMLWRNTDGTLVDWTMHDNVINSTGVLNLDGNAVKPDASWNVAGVGDFNANGSSDILWRSTNGSLAEWDMNGSTILSSNSVTFNGAAVNVDASWSVAGVGDFNGDNRRDVLWRNSDGTLADWAMNGNVITSSGVLSAGGNAVKPDGSWSVAGVGDFNGDGNSDILWRNVNGSLAEWLMNGSSVTSSGSITFGGAPIAPDASWHVVEIGDFNGDNQSDVLWRNDNGALAEWLMNGTTVVSSVTPNADGAAVSPEAGWSTQAKPTNFG
jgi:ELWxxDGT repeat protein